jgi:lantibiotic modifying enzyme
MAAFVNPVFPDPAGESSWRPLVRGREAARVREVLTRVARALPELSAARETDTPVGPSLARGWAGQALFWSYLSAVDGDGAAADRAEVCLDRALEALEEGRMGWGLFGGFSGIGWVSAHLEGRLYEAEGGEDLHEEIDGALAELVGGEPWAGHFDLISGLTGLGLYALERLPRPVAMELLEGVVTRLAEWAETRTEGVVWKTPRERLPPHRRDDYPGGVIDLGVAHGMAGVLPVLAGACRAGVAESTARPLLEGGIGWLLAQDLGDLGEGRFPPWVAEEETPQPTRLAWCYGDAGIAAALLWTARLVGEAAWDEAARDLARSAALRGEDTAGVQDAGLCHGSAGLAHLFNRLFQVTGDRVVGEAARRWLARTLTTYRSEEALTGFLSLEPLPGGGEGWTETAGFLTGAAGIGLALAAAISSVPPDWDRALLIAVEPDRGAP